MPLGKFFTLSPAGVAGCIVEIEGENQEAGATVVTCRPSGHAEAALNHQLWWEDRPNNSIRSKLNNLCLTADKDGKVTLQPYQSLNRNQRWKVDGTQIRSRDNEKVIGLEEQESHPGGYLYTQDDDETYGDEWAIKHTEAHYMHIRHSATQKVMDVAWESTKSGANLIVYDMWAGMKDNQLWYEDEKGLIRSKLTDFYLTSDEGEMTLQPHIPNCTSQQWGINQSAITNFTDPNYVLDISKPRFSLLQNIKGSFQVIGTNYNGGADQYWEFLYVDHCEATFCPTSRYVHLCHEATGLLMTALPLHTIGIPSDRINVILDSPRGDTCKEQQWELDEKEKRIISVVDRRCLDLSGDEAVLQKRERHSWTQTWQLDEMRIQNIGDPDLFLGTSSGVLSPDSTGFNRVVSHKADDANPPDLWKATKAAASFFYIKSKANCEFVLDVKAGNKDSGSEVIIYKMNSEPTANQLWYEDEEGLLRSKLNGYVCDGTDGFIRMRPYRRGAGDQQWVLFGDVIKNQSRPDQCFDIRRNWVRNGTSVIPYKFNNQPNQKWVFEYV